MTNFFRFPHTPHLAWLGTGEPRDDKVLSAAEARALLDATVVVEEKLDGANLGLSVGPDGRVRAQNRGQYLQPPFGGQFARLNGWLTAHEGALFDALDTHLIAFGEWCTARHSLEYTALPDWWLVFDVYDRREGRFWCTRRRDEWAHDLGLTTTPALLRGQTDLATLKDTLNEHRSRYRDGPMEGVVIRVDDEHWLHQRAKLVRPDFTQQIDQHWRRNALVWNHLEPTT
ncbi:MAG: RNA ligase [Candidatus Accumulibacter regalis]|jgi:ATP-dependent RNA circularization protein (DNA/RNA ligase family)|uniref:RNA ligase n=1 Tax=Accumulibacter regalis TaxID=522306 RepID=A0A011PT92_ACCRE|nr:RNA ligase family protein [Accumulibacter sp.]EXI90621.1 MAG: RNA ligase [Candidatus Accumulibacter regalis]MBL8366645.1 RNA ligase family protein [Accumulibacter sp.]MBN8513623.1 RNA ligase family protein [Accumulibacter sp.]MBO3702061.1 RNA ligase family protein [Accumulibacter sp.]HRE69203.1 RNA ligase family protein [Accumulibacter sp.]